MNRRAFLSSLLGAAAGVVAEPYLHKAFSFPSAPGLAFSKDAFNFGEGLSMRFVRSWDVKGRLLLSRIDVLYGWSAITGGELREMACRDLQFVEDSTWRQAIRT